MSLFDEKAAPIQFSREAKRAAIEREIKMRRRVYPRWVDDKRMTQAQADEQIAVMVAILADYDAPTAGET